MIKFCAIIFILTVINLPFSNAQNSAISNEWIVVQITKVQHNAFGFFEKIGIPGAEKLLEQEESLSPRIVGGDEVDIVHYKYQVGLLVQIVNITGIGLCGGSLISKNRVATAAHCWYDGVHQGKSMTVVLGSSTIFSGGTRINTTEVYVHSDWEPAKVANDVAVVYLPRSVTFSDSIAPIALPSNCEINEDFVGETAIASGFGRTGTGIKDLVDDLDVPISNDQGLSKVQLTVISNEECSATYSLILQPSNVCTSGKGPEVNVVAICNGDSGGPLAVMRNGRAILIGIASFGSPLGCNNTMPHGYSRVTYYLDFFKKHMKQEKESA